ncbi:MAG TPA: metallophosphoesterase [Balneolaceae bacterium]|nr:metallophosphoesterase [Balneolaceae bacterium]
MPWTLKMTLIISGLLIVFMLYTGSRLFWSIKMTFLQNPAVYKGILIIAGLFFIAYPAAGLVQYFATGFFTPDDYPKILIYLFWYGFIFSAVMVSWTILLDILSASLKYGFKINPPQLDTLLGWVMIGVTLIMLAYTGIKTAVHSTRIVVNEITYPVQKHLAEDFEPLKIVHISDLHADRFTTPFKTTRYIEKVNSLKPDLVLFTGDLITAGDDHIEEGADAIGNIDATYGTYAVMGDHDYWQGEQVITDALTQRGVTVLRNQTERFTHKNKQIGLTGITELYSKKLIPSELQELFEPDDNDDYKIVFSHQATTRIIDLAEEHNFQLVLGGHTHGGQIRIPVFFYPLTPVLLETEYVKGKKWFDDLLLNVNSGLGYTLAPLRYGAPAQISLVRVE